MKIKICGLCQRADAELAITLGATHVGIVLAPDSPRCANRRNAAAIAAAARGRAEVVLVFRSVDDQGIVAAADALDVRTVQVHDADGARLERLHARGLRAMAVHRLDAACVELPRFEPAPCAGSPVLLDGGAGGAGTAFDWRILGDAGPEYVFVAGGIRPDNIAALLRRRPWGIDVSSGAEASPGHKDPARMRALFEAVRAAAAMPITSVAPTGEKST
ncbi:MAG: hypothetical protein AB8H80_08495 [Planctomycetota bacterium]